MNYNLAFSSGEGVTPIGVTDEESKAFTLFAGVNSTHPTIEFDADVSVTHGGAKK